MKLSRSKVLTVALNQLVCEGTAFARNLILARLLGPEEMGGAVVLALGLRLIEMIGDFGWERMLVQVNADDLPSVRTTVHGLQIFKSFGQTLLALPLSVLLLWIYAGLSLHAWLLIALALLIRGFIHWDYRERQRAGRFEPALIVEGGSHLIALAMTLPIAWFIRDHSLFAWSMVLQACVLAGLSHCVAQRPYRARIDQHRLGRCMRYGLPLAVNSALMFLALQGDRFVVSAFFSPGELAAFALAAQLTLLPALLGARILLTLRLPTYARLLDDPGTLDIQYARDSRWLAVAAVMLACSFGIAGSAFIELLYGSAYELSSLCIWLLAISAALRLMRALPNTLLLSAERTKTLLWTNTPRLLALPVAIALAANGAELSTIIYLAVVSEGFGLAIGITQAKRERCRKFNISAKPSYQEAT